MSEEEEFKILLEKYIKGKCSKEEEQQFEAWYFLQLDKPNDLTLDEI